MKYHECARKRAFRSSERLVRAKKREGQLYKHRNWDDCRSKVGRVRFRTVLRRPVRLGRLRASWGDSRPPPSIKHSQKQSTRQPGMCSGHKYRMISLLAWSTSTREQYHRTYVRRRSIFRFCDFRFSGFATFDFVCFQTFDFRRFRLLSLRLLDFVVLCFQTFQFGISDFSVWHFRLFSLAFQSSVLPVKN